MKIKIREPKWFTEIGKKDNQEDFLWPDPKSVSVANRVFIMCDGMGGMDSGELASATAATALGEYISSHLPEDEAYTPDMFREALSHAYDELDKVDTGALRKMGTTMTCVVLHKGGVLAAHIGDSRIYHVRPSLSDEDGRTGIVYQSSDHSLVNDLLRAGEITEEEAENFPQKNIITRAMQPNLERRYKADIYNLDDVQGGDYLFLCCDGVLENLTNDMLGAVLSEESFEDDDARIAAIKEQCDERTRDNYTCWLIPIDKVTREATDHSTAEDEVVAIVEAEEESEAPTKEGVSNTGSNWMKYAIIVVLLVLAAVCGWFVKDWLGSKPSEEGAKEEKTEEVTTDKKDVQRLLNETDKGKQESEKPAAQKPEKPAAQQPEAPAAQKPEAAAAAEKPEAAAAAQKPETTGDDASAERQSKLQSVSSVVNAKQKQKKEEKKAEEEAAKPEQTEKNNKK